MPAIYGRALTREEIGRRVEQKGLVTAEGAEVLGLLALGRGAG